MVYSCRITIDSSPSQHRTRSPDQTRCGKISCRGDSIHVFTTTIHSFPSQTTIFLCSTNIPLASNTVFTLSIHPMCGLPLNLTSDLFIFSPIVPLPFSLHVQTIATLAALLNQPTLTGVQCTSSFLSLSM